MFRPVMLLLSSVLYYVSSESENSKECPCVRMDLAANEQGDTGYYFDDNVKIPYLTAYEYCREQGMHLFSTEKDKDFVTKTIFDLGLSPDVSYWTSAYNLKYGGKYKMTWLTTDLPVDSPVQGYDDVERCMVLYPRNGKFYQRYCHHELGVICQTVIC